MRPSDRTDHSNRRPVVALLVTHWDTRTEHGWITRQVAGALACGADVHVITLDGTSRSTTSDSVFTIHHLATPIEPSAELGRELLLASITESSPGDPVPVTRALTDLINRDLDAPWHGVAEVLATLSPDRVVIAGHQNVGAMTAVDRYGPDIPVSLLALAGYGDSLAFPLFASVFDRAQSILTVTHMEHESVVSHHRRPGLVHRIGAPLTANPSVLTESDISVGGSDYVLILTGALRKDGSWETELSDLLRMRFPDQLMCISSKDSFCIWDRGYLDEGRPIERATDMYRLMAWARVTVDLRPGRLLGRRSVESLLYGTPIVVPEASAAREHADLGQAGLWFANPSELAWCVEALFEDSVRDRFGTQGRSYAEKEYSSTDLFIGRVLTACGLASTDSEVRVS